MATTTSPSNTSGPSKQSSGRPSTSSSLAGYSPMVNYSQGIGCSPPTPISPPSSGIPSFRSLRSLLPFVSKKNATTTTTTSLSTSPNTRSSFGAFSSVRRSMTKDRERNMSLSIDAPVIAIEKSNGDFFPDDTPVIRRSVSLSKIEKPLPSEPAPKDPSSTSLGDNLLTSCALYLFFPCSHTQLSLLILPFELAFTLRTPSPGPALSAELSTIIEADNSGVLKQVRDAMLEGDSLKDQWLNADKEVIIIDGDENPDLADTTFNMESVDRDLAELLSPHSVGKQVPNSSTPTSSPIPASPASRLPRARQTSSFIPRLGSSSSPSITRIPIHHSHTPPPPASKPSPTTVNGYNALSPIPRVPTNSLSTVNGYNALSLRDSRVSPIPRVPNSPSSTVGYGRTVGAGGDESSSDDW